MALVEEFHACVSGGEAGRDLNPKSMYHKRHDFTDFWDLGMQVAYSWEVGPELGQNANSDPSGRKGR